MQYEATSHKFAILLNTSKPMSVLFNACSHLCFGLGARLAQEARILDYPAPALGVTSGISLHPVIVLQAKSSAQIVGLLEKARAAGHEIWVNVFDAAMLGRSADEQRSRTAALTIATADLVAAALYGPRPAVEALTKKYSLLRDPRPCAEGIPVPPAL